MPGIVQAPDRTSSYRGFSRATWAYRPVANVTYLPGMALQLVSQDLQVYPDEACVALPSAGTLKTKCVGVVSDTWPGFAGALSSSPTYLSPANISLGRGTTLIEAITQGFHTGVLVDQGATGAITITDGLGLVPVGASGQAGFLMGIGVAAATPLTVVAMALLPASGLTTIPGYSITAAALAQASQTDTLTGTPAAGDVLSVTIQTPYIATAPGVVQTTTWSYTLKTADAVSVTTAATALTAYLNTQTSFTAWFVATSSAGVVTVTVNAAAFPATPMLWNVNFAGPGIGNVLDPNNFQISMQGMVANTLTFAVATAAGGGTISTAGATTLASGTGFKGYIPAWVIGKM